MNYEMLDLLDKAIEKCGVDDIELLKTEGIFVDNQINVNKVNLMVGAYASDLVDCMINAEMNPFSNKFWMHMKTRNIAIFINISQFKRISVTVFQCFKTLHFLSYYASAKH